MPPHARIDAASRFAQTARRAGKPSAPIPKCAALRPATGP